MKTFEEAYRDLFASRRTDDPLEAERLAVEVMERAPVRLADLNANPDFLSVLDLHVNRCLLALSDLSQSPEEVIAGVLAGTFLVGIQVGVEMERNPLPEPSEVEG